MTARFVRLVPVILTRTWGGWLWLTIGVHFTAVLLNLFSYAVLVALTAAGGLGAIAGALEGPPSLHVVGWALLILVVIPVALVALPTYFVPGQRYRVYGESSFLILALPYLMGVRS